MDVILLERIERLGQMGDVVNVKPGFARNFLFPKKKALRASKDNLAYFESKKAELEATNAKRKGEAEATAKKLTGAKLLLVRQAGEGGQLYGSVSARDIADGLIEQGYKIDRSHVQLNVPVKTLGVFTVPVRLHADVKLTVEVTVARSQEEADLHAAQAAALLERAEDAEKLLAETAPKEEGAEDEAQDQDEADEESDK